MPYAIRKVKKGWKVYNRATGKVHAKHTTKQRAQKQLRLLRGLEYGMKTRRRK